MMVVGVVRDGDKGRGMARPQAKLWWGGGLEYEACRWFPLVFLYSGESTESLDKFSLKLNPQV